MGGGDIYQTAGDAPLIGGMELFSKLPCQSNVSGLEINEGPFRTNSVRVHLAGVAVEQGIVLDHIDLGFDDGVEGIRGMVKGQGAVTVRRLSVGSALSRRGAAEILARGRNFVPCWGVDRRSTSP